MPQDFPPTHTTQVDLLASQLQSVFDQEDTAFEVAHRLKDALDEKGLTELGLARQLGTTEDRVRAWESGNIDSNELVPVIEALQLTEHGELDGHAPAPADRSPASE